MTIDKDGLAAAAIQLASLRGMSVADEVDQAMFGADAAKVVTAYLSALPDTGDELVARLRGRLADYDADLQVTIAAGILPDRAAYGEDVSGVTCAEISQTIDALTAVIAERDGLREANRKLHRRAQLAEAVSQSTIGQLASWLTYLAYPSKHRRRQDRYLVQWIVRDVRRVAEKLQARTALLNTKENGE